MVDDLRVDAKGVRQPVDVQNLKKKPSIFPEVVLSSMADFGVLFIFREQQL